MNGHQTPKPCQNRASVDAGGEFTLAYRSVFDGATVGARPTSDERHDPDLHGTSSCLQYVHKRLPFSVARAAICDAASARNCILLATLADASATHVDLFSARLAHGFEPRPISQLAVEGEKTAVCVRQLPSRHIQLLVGVCARAPAQQAAQQVAAWCAVQLWESGDAAPTPGADADAVAVGFWQKAWQVESCANAAPIASLEWSADDECVLVSHEDGALVVLEALAAGGAGTPAEFDVAAALARAAQREADLDGVVAAQRLWAPAMQVTRPARGELQKKPERATVRRLTSLYRLWKIWLEERRVQIDGWPRFEQTRRQSRLLTRPCVSQIQL